MAEIRLIGVDLDGTLLRSDGTLAQGGSHCLAAARRRGVRVIISTTRNPDTAAAFAREIGLQDPLICTNGAQILASPEGPAWVYRQLPSELAHAFVDAADAAGWSLITTVSDTTYYLQRPGQALGASGPHRMVVARNVDALAYGDPIRILSYEADAIAALEDLCRNHAPERVHVETYYNPDESVKSIGLYAAGSDKGTAMKVVLSRLRLEPDVVMAIGDNPNDLPMFAEARVRVAMGNATNVVKQAATQVAPSNDAEGVAWAVRKFVPIGEEDGDV